MTEALYAHRFHTLSEFKKWLDTLDTRDLDTVYLENNDGGTGVTITMCRTELTDGSHVYDAKVSTS